MCGQREERIKWRQKGTRDEMREKAAAGRERRDASVRRARCDACILSLEVKITSGAGNQERKSSRSPLAISLSHSLASFLTHTKICTSAVHIGKCRGARTCPSLLLRFSAVAADPLCLTHTHIHSLTHGRATRTREKKYARARKKIPEGDRRRKQVDGGARIVQSSVCVYACE